jgi:hypothetical protein
MIIKRKVDLPLFLDNVKHYKFLLGTILQHRLDWTGNTTLLGKKGNKSIYFLYVLNTLDNKAVLCLMSYD